MQVPLEMTFRGLERTPHLEEKIRRRVEKLEKFHSRIVACRVAVEKPHEHPSSGNPYRVRIDVTVPPKHEIVVKKEPGDHDLNEELATVLNDAFDATERQLKEVKDRQSGEVKTHEENRAFVVRLFEDEGYGFLKTPEEREIYFHQNALAREQSWDRVTVGTQVRFVESEGEMGPQASTVQIIDKPGKREVGGEEEESEKPSQPPAGWRQEESE